MSTQTTKNLCQLRTFLHQSQNQDVLQDHLQIFTQLQRIRWATTNNSGFLSFWFNHIINISEYIWKKKMLGNPTTKNMRFTTNTSVSTIQSFQPFPVSGFFNHNNNSDNDKHLFAQLQFFSSNHKKKLKHFFKNPWKNQEYNIHWEKTEYWFWDVRSVYRMYSDITHSK